MKQLKYNSDMIARLSDLLFRISNDVRGVGIGSGVGSIGSGRVQLFSLVNILFNSNSAWSTVLSLKTQPAQLSR